MACFSGPEIVNDGLVFAYDMSNSQKSFVGEPTTNLFSSFSTNQNNAVLVGVSPISLACGGDANWSRCNYGGGTYFFNHVNTVNPYGSTSLVGNLIATVTGGDYRATIFNIGSNTLNRTFTFSMWVKNNGGISTNISMSMRTNGDENGPTVSKIISNDWQRLSITHTFTGTCTNEIRCYLFGIDAGRDILLYHAQLEEKPFATPFVNGTRSNTQAILDLTNNNTITANSLTYNADGTFSFDATNFNKITVNNSAALQLTNTMSFTGWIKPNATQNNPFPRVVHKIDSNHGYLIHIGQTFPSTLAFNVYNNGTVRQTAQTVITAGEWQHIAATYDGQVGKIYRNGVLIRTVDFGSVLSASVDSSPLYIGNNQVTNNRDFNGDIAAINIYNTTLTASEVLQNFNALRGRYNI